MNKELSDHEPLLMLRFAERSLPCPICGYAIKNCQCIFSGTTHPNRDNRLRVVLDHLYLFKLPQILHLVNLQRVWKIDYDDANLKKEYNELLKNFK